MTGLEAVEEEERERRRKRRIAALVAEGEAAREEHDKRETQRAAEITESWRQSQIESQLTELDSGDLAEPSSLEKSSFLSRAKASL
jgi:hypothetical protein